MLSAWIVFFASSLALANQCHVLVLGIDGMSGYEFDHYLHSSDYQSKGFKILDENGVFSRCESEHDPRCARTHSGQRLGPSYFWVTSPGWASVLTAVDADMHGVRHNGFLFQKAFAETAKTYPTFFKILKDMGFSVAAGGVGAFLTSYKNKTIYTGITDYECGIHKLGPAVKPEAQSSCNLTHRLALNNADEERDSKLAYWLIGQIASGTDVIMGVFDSVDAAGHKYGFGLNHKYIDALDRTDHLVAQIIDALKERLTTNDEEWRIIATSDHGGHTILNNHLRTFKGMHDVVKDEDEVVPFGVSQFYGHSRMKDHRAIGKLNLATNMDTHRLVRQWVEQCY